jgi:hypothetical protein
LHDASRFIPYEEQSVSLATQWAIGNTQQGFSRTWNWGGVPTGEQIAGGRFPDGTVADPIYRQYHSLLTARAISERQTLNERHVNLESGIGRFLKQQMDLPFQEHSRVDPLKASRWAADLFSGSQRARGAVGLVAAWGAVFSLLAGGVYGLGPYAQGAWATHHWKNVGGVHVLQGADWNGVFSREVPSRLGQAEIWMHGGGNPWRGTVSDYLPGMYLQDAINSAARQSDVQAILVASCNMQHALPLPPAGKKLIFGLGLGVGAESDHWRGWTDAVVVAQGRKATVYPANSLYAYKYGQNFSWPRATTATAAQKAAGWDKLPAYNVGIYRTPQGRDWIVGGGGTRRSFAVPIENAPHLDADILGPNHYQFHLPGGGTTTDYDAAAGRLAVSYRSSKRPIGLSSEIADIYGESEKDLDRLGAKLIPRRLPAITPRAMVPALKSTPAEATRTIAARGTLAETHVNLESTVGRFFKKLWKLPFKKHSRIDPLPNALFAEVNAARPAGYSSFLEGLIQSAQQGERPDLITKNLRRYATALEPFAGEIEKPLGAGVSSLALQLRGGNVLKLSDEALQEGLGTRAIDAPILARGTVRAGAQTAHFLVQPKVEMARTPAESARFFGALKKAGYEGWDPGERQFGYHQGRAVLVDYDAATIQSGRAEFPGRASARQLPQAMAIEVGEQSIERRMSQSIAETKSAFYRPVAETAEQSVAFQSLPQQLTRSAVREGLQEPLRVAAIVSPTARQGANTARAMAARATVNELHQNLESPAGQFFKKVMRLPFMKRSRWDRMLATTFAATTFAGILPNALAQGPAGAPINIARGNPSVHALALTFDDGPYPGRDAKDPPHPERGGCQGDLLRQG